MPEPEHLNDRVGSVRSTFHLTGPSGRIRAGAPTRLDRIECHHWVTCAIETLRTFEPRLYDFAEYPATDEQGSGSLANWQGDLHQTLAAVSR